MKVTVFSEISIDGKLTLGAGNSSKELFSLLDQDDMRFIHKFRGEVDGIMVGRKTVETDNPSLTNRYELNKNPVRIVPSRSIDIPKESNILKDNVKTIIVTTEVGGTDEKIDFIKSRGKDCLICGKDGVDFEMLFKKLESEYNIKSIMLEGGGNLNWSLFEKDLVDEIILMQLPVIIGGESNISLVDGKGFTDLNSIKKFKVSEVEPRKNYTLMKYTRNYN